MRRKCAFGSVPMLSCLIILILLAFSTIAPAQKDGNPNPGILPTNSYVHGASYGEWLARHIIWTASKPFSGFDFSPPIIYEGQSGKVFHIPWLQPDPIYLSPGTTLCLNGSNWFFSWNDPAIIAAARETATSLGVNPDELTLEELLRLWNKYNMDFCEDMSVWIDGKLLKDAERYRVQTPIFSFTQGAGWLTIWGTDCSGYHDYVVGEGYVWMLAPLPPGTHHIRQSYTWAGVPWDDTYTIIVR